MRIVEYTRYLNQRPMLACILVFLAGLLKVTVLISPLFFPLTFFSFLAMCFAALTVLSGSFFLGLLLMLLVMLPADGLPLVLLLSSKDKVQNFNLWIVGGIAILSNMMIYANAVLLNREVGWGRLLEINALFFALIICILHVIYPDIIQFWEKQLLLLQTLNTPAHVLSSQGGGLNEMQIQMINTVKIYINGMIASAVLLSALVLLLFSRAWQNILTQDFSWRKEIANVRLQYLTGILFLAAVIAGYFNNRVITDIMPILLFIFCLAGLSWVHYLFQNWQDPGRTFWIMLFYFFLFFTLSWSVKVLAALGFLDVFFNFRKRLMANKLN